MNVFIWSAFTVHQKAFNYTYYINSMKINKANSFSNFNSRKESLMFFSFAFCLLLISNGKQYSLISLWVTHTWNASRLLILVKRFWFLRLVDAEVECFLPDSLKRVQWQSPCKNRNPWHGIKTERKSWKYNFHN